MERCPLNSQPCEDENACPLRIRLDDFQGCPFDLADRAIQHFKTHTLLPAALKLDDLVRRCLHPTDKKNK